MHVYLTARHMELTDAIRDYVERRIVSNVRSHNSLAVRRLEVQLFREGNKGPFFGCHVLVEAGGRHERHEINVREIDKTNLYEAIDLAEARVLRQLSELRDELLTVRRHPRKYSIERFLRALGIRRAREV